MAVTPKQAIGNKREIERERIDALEKQFDELLVNDYDGRHGVSISTPKGVSDFVLAEVVRRFEAAGWTVKRECGGDQREEWDNLIFTATKGPYPQMGEEGR